MGAEIAGGGAESAPPPPSRARNSLTLSRERVNLHPKSNPIALNPAHGHLRHFVASTIILLVSNEHFRVLSVVRNNLISYQHVLN